MISAKDFFRTTVGSTTLAILLVSILSIYFTGYSFGTADNLNILIAVQQLKDPSFLSNDLTFSGASEIGRFLLLRMILYLSYIVPLEPLFFILFVTTRVLFCAGFYRLALSMTRDRAAALLSVMAVFYVFDQRIPLGSAHLVSEQFYSSYLAITIALFAIASFIKKRQVSAFVLTGVATNIHFLTGTQITGILSVYLLVHWREEGWKTVLKSLLVYLIIASPELINAVMLPLKNAHQAAISTKEYIEIIGYMRTPHHWIPSTWTMEEYLRYAIFIVAGAYSYFKLGRSAETNRGFKICIIAALIVGVFTPLIYRSSSVMLYHPYRMTAWPFAIMTVFIVRLIVVSMDEKTIPLKAWSVFSLAFLNAPYILTLLFSVRMAGAALWERTRANILFLLLNSAIFASILLVPRRRDFIDSDIFRYMLKYPVQSFEGYLFISLLLAGLIHIFLKNKLINLKNITLLLFPLTIFLLTMSGINFIQSVTNEMTGRFQPRMRSMSENIEFIDMCSWIKKNTGRKDVIITPPLMEDIRFYSERAILVNFKFYPLASDMVKEWYERLDEISRGDLSKQREDILNRKTYRDKPHPGEILETGYRKLDGSDFSEIGRKYRCSYVITESGHEVPLKKVYSNSKYNVYELSRDGILSDASGLLRING